MVVGWYLFHKRICFFFFSFCYKLFRLSISQKKRYAADGEEQTVLESMRDYLLNTIQKTFEVGIDQAECLYQELLQCTRNKNLVKKEKSERKSPAKCFMIFGDFIL